VLALPIDVVGLAHKRRACARSIRAPVFQGRFCLRQRSLCLGEGSSIVAGARCVDEERRAWPSFAHDHYAPRPASARSAHFAIYGWVQDAWELLHVRWGPGTGCIIRTNSCSSYRKFMSSIKKFHKKIRSERRDRETLTLRKLPPAKPEAMRTTLGRAYAANVAHRSGSCSMECCTSPLGSSTIRRECVFPREPTLLGVVLRKFIQPAKILTDEHLGGVEFIDENGGGPGVRLRKSPKIKSHK
jgi:hypothetical protein